MERPDLAAPADVLLASRRLAAMLILNPLTGQIIEIVVRRPQPWMA